MSERKHYSPVYLPSSEFDLFMNFNKADLHLHTKWSDGIATPEEMVELALLAGMNAIAVTDHDVSVSSDIALNYAQRNSLPIEVIRGMEVSSKNGHILALNIESHVNANMPLAETLKEIHKQNGFAIIPHPGLKKISSIPLLLIDEIINSEDPDLYFDGIEIFNATAAKISRLDKSGLFFGDSIANIRKFIDKNIGNPKLGAFFGGTDSHTRGVGYGITVYEQNSVLDAIRNKMTRPMSADTDMWGDFMEMVKMTYSIIRSHIITNT